MTKVVEPSEILIDRRGLPREEIDRIDPWVRFLARGFDYSLFLAFLGIGRWLLGGHLPLGSFEGWIPFEFFSWIPLEALFLSTWGKTFGKFFLKIELRQGRKRRLDFFTALKRSFNVWFRGLGMGIALISVFCLLFAYYRLKVTHQMSWDREENITLVQQPVGQWRLITATIFSGCSFLAYFLIKISLF